MLNCQCLSFYRFATTIRILTSLIYVHTSLFRFRHRVARLSNPQNRQLFMKRAKMNTEKIGEYFLNLNTWSPILMSNLKRKHTRVLMKFQRIGKLKIKSYRRVWLSSINSFKKERKVKKYFKDLMTPFKSWLPYMHHDENSYRKKVIEIFRIFCCLLYEQPKKIYFIRMSLIACRIDFFNEKRNF